MATSCIMLIFQPDLCAHIRGLNSSSIGEEKNPGPAVSILRFLSSGHFYLSPTFDLTNTFQRLQTRQAENTSGNA